MKYCWYVSDNLQGEAESYEDAFDSMKDHLPWIDEAWTVIPSPFEQKEFFYRTEEEMEEDEDGTYTPFIQAVEEV